MGEFGALAPFGLLTFGAAESDAETIYRSMSASLVKAFDMTEGTHVEASTYARALAIASARAVVKHAANQRRPMFAVEFLPALERQYRLVPIATDSNDARRRAVAARKILNRGPRRSSVKAALSALLGSSFIQLRALRYADSETYTFPASPEDAGAWDDSRTLGKFFRFLGLGAMPGAFTFTYEPLLDDGSHLDVGDVVACQVENPALAEAITITAVDNTVTPLQATATFVNAHDCLGSIRSHAPLWIGSQRTLLVVVSDAASIDAPTRKKIHALMHRLVRATTVWAIVQESTPGTLGPFTIGTSPLGAVTLGSITTD